MLNAYLSYAEYKLCLVDSRAGTPLDWGSQARLVGDFPSFSSQNLVVGSEISVVKL